MSIGFHHWFHHWFHQVPLGRQRMGPWARNAGAVVHIAAIQIHSKAGRFFAFRMWARCHKHFWRSAAKRDGTLSVPIGFTPLTARARSSLGPPSQRSSPPFNKQWFVAIESRTLSGDQSSTANLKKSLNMRWVPSVSMDLKKDNTYLINSVKL